MAEHNHWASVDFLERWRLGGPWVLTAIRPDRKAIDTRTFADPTKVLVWLETHQDRNIYFSVNPLLREVQKKAEREDVAEVAWLHVDIDPRVGEDPASEQERALRLLTEGSLPEGVPEPTVVIFSGGGYQGFWRLQIPIPVNGDLSVAESAADYNRQLEYLFGGDHCHNIDRIMRLPGTVNWPDAKKQKKGRRPVQAQLVWFTSTSYPLSAFRPAPPLQSPALGGPLGQGPGPRVGPGLGNVERLASVDDLDKWGVPERYKVVIVQGRHPEEEKVGDGSRSAWLWDALCGLVRAAVPDEVIFSIITDREFGISESVLDKGASAAAYARRQIGRAREEAINPWLRKLNERFAVIGNMGGRCRVIEEVYDAALKRTGLTRQTFEDFRNRWMHENIKIGEHPRTKEPVYVSVGKYWLGSALRRQYDTLVFAPGEEVAGAYNLWQGFAVQSRPGDCSLYLRHIEDNICSGHQKNYEYLLNWMARGVQKPGSPGEVAVVLRGGKGVGKSVFAKGYGRLLGRHFLHISNPSHLVGNFNSHLRDVVVLFADEAFFAGDRKHASVLQTLITEEMITIEAKGVDAEAAPNYVHLIMASNSQHVIPAGGDERRYFVLDVGAGKQQDTAYFRAIAKQMENGGAEALLHFLLERDISEFDVRTSPKTEALAEQKLFSLTTEEEWWFRKLQDGVLLPYHKEWQPEVRKAEIVDDYIEQARRWQPTRRGNETALGRFLIKMAPGLRALSKMANWREVGPEGYEINHHRPAPHFVFPSLADCQARWEFLYGPQEWPAASPTAEEPKPERSAF